MNSGLFFVLLLFSRFIFAEQSGISRLCILQSSCKSCLGINNECSWCSDWNYSNSTVGKPRCNTKSRLLEFGCDAKKVLTTSSSSVEFLENDDFQDVIRPDQLPVQLRPQKAHVRVRPGTTETLRLQYRPAKNYPLDLYYLMDFTYSMNPHKEKLVNIGEKMARTLGNLTTNFRLGFGSFADKPLMPYIAPGTEARPCSNCGPIYAFKHHMALTNDVEKFFREVNASKLTGNLDDPEGAMDGIVQAISCTEEVKWAQQARKLILVATNSLSHFAGDGKLAGAVRRQDFRCHLNQGEYSMSKEFDYPSLEEIYHLLYKKKVNLIFAVSSLERSANKIDFHDNSKVYEQIVELLEETARVGYLQEDSSNILEIIEKAYREIIAKVVLRDDSDSPNVSIEYYSNCGNKTAGKTKTSTCQNVKEAQIYEFDIRFSAKECPANRSLRRQTVTIDDALASETSKLEVDVELICDCDCQGQGATSSNCFHGIDECGVCKCDHGWTGETCGCDVSLFAEQSAHCIKPGGSSICSNRGECSCGHCECDRGYDGPHCECSPCDVVDGLECSGKGTCDCGKCNCLEGWQGSACQCQSGNRPCIAPGSDNVCANHGYCDCGQCRCNVTDSQGLLYRGVYCESSASAGGSEICNRFSICVSKKLDKSPDADAFCSSNSTRYNVELVDSIDRGHENYCSETSDEGTRICRIHFAYDYDEDNTVKLRIEKECTGQTPTVYIFGLIIFTIVIGGILMLTVWRLFAFVMDRREFAKFEEERKNTVYSINFNPLYRDPVQKFRVPDTFKEDSS